MISLMPVYYRLKNIGMNGWWCLLMFVPIANIIVVFRCLICQEGYQDLKRLDSAGRIIIYIFFGILLLFFGLVIFAIMVAA